MKPPTNSNTMFAILFLLFFSTTFTTVMGSHAEKQNNLIIHGHGGPIQLSNVVCSGKITIQDAPDTIIENFTCTNGATILVINSDNLIVRNNIIRNANSYALFVEYSDNVQIYNNTIEGGSNDGIISYGNDNVIIKNNIVSGVVKNGIFIDGNNVTLSDNQISNISGTGVFIQGSTDLVVENNSINSVDWTPIAPDQTSFDSGTFSGNTYNGLPLSDDDVNPAISNTFSTSSDGTTITSSVEDSQTIADSVTDTETDNSSNDESYSPFTIFAIGLILISIYRKSLIP